MRHAKKAAQAIDNPYDRLYMERVGRMDKGWTHKDAENLVTNLGMMYNTIGKAMKDVISCLAGHLNSQSTNDTECREEKLEVEKHKKMVKQSTSNEVIKKNIFTDQNRNSNKQPSIFQKKEMKEHQGDDSFDIRSGFNPNQSMAIKRDSKGKNSQHTGKAAITSPKKDDRQEQSFRLSEYAYQQNLQNEQPGDTESLKNDVSAQSEPIFIEDDTPEQPSQPSSNTFFMEFRPKPKRDPMVHVPAGRKKDERAALKGVACMECEKFYSVFGDKGREMCDCTSRHRSRNARSYQPPTDFSQQFKLDQ